MKKIYVCSPLKANPFTGTLEQNVKNARDYSRRVVMENSDYLPVCPHIYFSQFIDDNIAEEREIGLKYGLEMLSECSEMWVFGEYQSTGMTGEIKKASELGIPVKMVRSNNIIRK
jgi:hypothetical protein